MRRAKISVAILTILICTYFAFPFGKTIYLKIAGSTANLEEVRRQVIPRLNAALTEVGLRLGQPVFIRVFKEERQLEVWLEDDGTYTQFKTYQICNFSGDLGPKIKEGDRQSPEGFYHVDEAAMNPSSSYHLSFNLGFPNAFDQANSRTGSYLMIHGDCVSIGCYAMTDEGIEEIYLIVEAAHSSGQKKVPVHAFPFRMTSERLEKEQDNNWFSYWQNLKIGHDLFEKNLVPPEVTVADMKYAFSVR